MNVRAPTGLKRLIPRLRQVADRGPVKRRGRASRRLQRPLSRVTGKLRERARGSSVGRLGPRGR